MILKWVWPTVCDVLVYGVSHATDLLVSVCCCFVSVKKKPAASGAETELYCDDDTSLKERVQRAEEVNCYCWAVQAGLTSTASSWAIYMQWSAVSGLDTSVYQHA